MSEMTGELTGRCAVVTGGASGIGEACCALLAERGAKVVVADRNAERADAIVATLAERGGEALAFALDVTRSAECDALVAAAVAWAGSVDMAVNAAGIAGVDAPIVALGDENWRGVLAVNLDGVFFSMRAQLRQMAAQGRGSIVNIASVLGLVAPAAEDGAGYVASKHAVVGLTKAAALEHARSGVRVNAVAPGYIETPLLDGVPAEQIEAFRALHPAGRLGAAGEVAEAVAFLASDRSAFITGTVLPIDGGYTIR